MKFVLKQLMGDFVNGISGTTEIFYELQSCFEYITKRKRDHSETTSKLEWFSLNLLFYADYIFWSCLFIYLRLITVLVDKGKLTQAKTAVLKEQWYGSSLLSFQSPFNFRCYVYYF